MKIDILSKEAAQERLSAGGLHWVMYSGDSFDADLFAEWTGYTPSADEIAAVERELSYIAGSDLAVLCGL